MSEKDLWWKIVVVAALVAIAFASIWPIQEQIKFGIDLYGGYSLLYEIDDTGLTGAEKQNLSERVMRVLRERVDPKGVYNLVWRPVGHNRLEIQMPRPSEAVQAARAEYERLQEEIRETMLRRSILVAAISKPPDERPAAMAALVHGIEARPPLIEAAAAAYEAYKKMEADYEARRSEAQAQAITREAVVKALQLPNAEREAAFEALKKGVPLRGKLLQDAAAASDAVRASEEALAQAKSAATSQPDGSVPQDPKVAALQQEVTTNKQTLDAAVQAVLDTNIDPDTQTDGPTIDKVLELEERFDKAVADVLETNLDIGHLQAVLDAKPADAFRQDELAKMTRHLPGLADRINRLVQVADDLKQVRRGEGRLEDPADLQRLLRGAGVLEFRILADPAELRTDPNKFASYIESLKTRGPRRMPGEETYQWFEIEDPKDFFDLRNPEVDFEKAKGNLLVVAERFGENFYVLAHVGEGYTLTHRPGEAEWSLKGASFDRDRTGRPAIGFRLDERGGAKFAVLTGQYKERQLCIFLDDQAISHARIASVIRTAGQITGSFTPQEVQEMVKKLNAGSLPKKLKDPPISVRSIGPSLGEANRTAGLRAAKYGAIGVAVFMLVYYFYAGGIAVIAVAMNLLFTGAMLSTLGATLTLPGVAGLVLAVGMAVDANVLINERIREELSRGSTMRMAVKLGYERAFRAILDSNVTTVLTCVILYFLGSEEIKGFGLTLGLGVFINLFTAYFVTRMFFELMCMFPIPKEITRNPILAAIVVAAAGAVLYGGGYFLNAPEERAQSVMIRFGDALGEVAVAIVGLLLLMFLGRWIHARFQKGSTPRMPMLRIIGTPKVDWIGLRYVFFGLSLALVIAGLLLFTTMDKDKLYDIEFLGGTAAQIDLKVPGSLNQAEIQSRLTSAGRTLRKYDQAMAGATVTGDSGTFAFRTPGIPAYRMGPFIRSVLDKKLSETGAITYQDPGDEAITVRLRDEAKVDLNEMQRNIRIQITERFLAAAEAMESAQVQAIQEVGIVGEKDRSFEIVTRETNKEIVVGAIMETMQNELDIQPALAFKLLDNTREGGVPYFPISSEDPRALGFDMTDAEALSVDLSGWRGGVAMVLDEIAPPQSIDVLRGRLKAMRLQPGFEKYGWRESEVFGLRPAAAGGGLFEQVMVVVADENFPLEDEQGGISSTWVAEVAEPEVELLEAALQRQTSLSQVTQFDKQVSTEAQTDAYIALTLSWLMIVIYLWFRFGNVRWGIAAVIALIHDVIIATGCIALTYYVADTVIGRALMLEKFRIDLALVAALLTVVGYSVNDTIVVFDRIRENRGRLAEVTKPMINTSISQTLSRTLLTILTSLISVVVMYVFGGRGIHGFSFVLIVGLVIGTYSSIGVASQILLRRQSVTNARTRG